MNTIKINPISMTKAYVQTTVGQRGVRAGVTKTQGGTPSGAANPQVVGSSLHTLSYAGTFSSDNFDFLWVSSEPF